MLQISGVNSNELSELNSKLLMSFIEIIKTKLNNESVLITFDEDVSYDILIKIICVVIWRVTDLNSEKLKKYFHHNIFYLDRKDYLSQNFAK